VWSVPADRLPDMRHVRTFAEEYDMKSAEAVLNTSAMIGSVTEEWSRRAEGRPTVVYAATLQHASSLLERFRSIGARTSVIHGKTPVAERTLQLRQLATGEVQVVINCLVLTEGWNCPEAKCAILARPTLSTALYVQMVGRILRITTGSLNPIVLDHVGNAIVHGLPHEDRVMTLDGLAPGEAGRPPSKVCPECLQVVTASAKDCSVCGHEFPDRSGAPRQLPGQLECIDEKSWFEKKRAWRELVNDATTKEMTIGWAKLRFGKRYGHPPPQSFLDGGVIR
jgi:DNA repair protein RadD